jgi:hypothetical protein
MHTLRTCETLLRVGAVVAGKLATEITNDSTLGDGNGGEEASAGVGDWRRSYVRVGTEGVSFDVDGLTSESKALGGAPNVALGRRRWGGRDGWRFALQS